jgi:hypothetical protein
MSKKDRLLRALTDEPQSLRALREASGYQLDAVCRRVLGDLVADGQAAFAVTRFSGVQLHTWTLPPKPGQSTLPLLGDGRAP